MMTNILIRGLDERTVERIDAEASALGISRNEFLRRTLEGVAPPGESRSVTRADWIMSADVFKDLEDPDLMDDAWR